MKTGILCVQGQQDIRPRESGSALLKFIEQDNKQATLSFSLFIICVIFEENVFMEGIFKSPFCKESCVFLV